MWIPGALKSPERTPKSKNHLNGPFSGAIFVAVFPTTELSL
jgi:hypothetical protein